MTTELKILGLSAPMSFTCEFDNDCTWIKSGMDVDRYKALFNWAKADDGFWKLGWVAVIECDLLSDEGYPINGKVITVKEKN